MAPSPGTPRALAEALVAELHAHGVRAELDGEIQYGWQVAVSGPEWEHWGRLNVYWGARGPSIPMQGLSARADPTTRELVAAAIAATLRQVDTRVPRSGPAAVAGAIEVWVDGAFVQSQGRAAVGWAFVGVRDDVELHTDSGSDVPPGAEKHRNVAGEAIAVLRALAWCREQGLASVTIYHDYIGLAKWPLGSYRAKLPFTRWYAAEVRGAAVDVHWEKVPAHSGLRWNERADALATGAARAALGEP